MLNKIYSWMSRRIFICVFVSLAAGYFYPLTPTPFWQKTIMVLFAYMTFATALGTSFKEFLAVSRKPKIPLYILSVVHIVTPLTAWVVGKLFFPDSFNVQIGFLIGAAIPVGVTSIIWTSIVKGNVPVSLVTVTLDTIISPLLLPLFILAVIGVAVKINYMAMAIDLVLMITLPSIVGMLLHDQTGGATKGFVNGIGGILSRLSFFAVIFINSAFVTPFIVWSAFILKILLVTLLLVTAGYFIGYGSSRLIGAGHGVTLAIVYNTGMRNIATGLVIASAYFPPDVAIPITMMILFQQPLAAVTAKVYEKCYPGYSQAVENQ